MKVLFLLDTLNQGGVEQLALDICRNSRDQGIELTMVAMQDGTLKDQFVTSGIEFIQLSRKKPIDFSVIKELRKIIAARGVRIVHSHQPVEGMHSYLATVGTGVKRVLSFHGPIPPGRNRFTARFLIPRMDANITVTNEFKSVMKREEGLDTTRNFHVIYNGIDSQRLIPTGVSIRDSLGLDKSAVLFGMIGSFVEWRDQKTACIAVERLQRTFADAHLVFAGGWTDRSPDYFDECLDYCKSHGLSDKVHFLGQSSHIPDIVKELDCFVSTSTNDSFGIAVVEAMMLGTPLLISDIAPFREITRDGEYARHFKVSDADDLAAKMSEAIANPAEYRQRARAATDWAKKAFSIENHIQSLKALYSTL